MSLSDFFELPLVTLTTSIGVFLIPLILTIYLYKKGKTRSSLELYSESHKIIDNAKSQNQEQVQIFFSGNPINELYKTHIYLWNNGTYTIKNSDLNTTYPLKIKNEDSCDILSCKIIKSTRDVINVTILDDKKISFDYLDPEDGFVIEVIHSSVKKPIITGIIMTIKNNFEEKQQKYELKEHLSKSIMLFTFPNKLMNMITFSLGFSFLIFSFILHLYRDTDVYTKIYEINSKLNDPIYSFIIMGISLIVLSINFFLLTKKPYPKNLIV